MSTAAPSQSRSSSSSTFSSSRGSSNGDRSVLSSKRSRDEAAAAVLSITPLDAPSSAGSVAAMASADEDAAEAEHGEFARPYSALMASIFSPPQTPSQNACAEAAASVLSGFSVPKAFDPVFYNQPDVQSVIVHSVSSSHKASGFQAIILLHPKSIVPSHLGLPQSYFSSSSSSSSSGSRPDETVYMMVSAKNQPFVAYNHAPKSQVLQVSIHEYLTLLSFWINEWSRLKSKLMSQIDSMRQGQNLVPITSTLAFYHHGFSNYSVSLSPRLTLKAKADSRSTKDDDCIRAWLELNSSGAAVQVFGLPVEALAELTQDTTSFNTLTNLVAGYKSRSRKRSKAVA